MYLIIGVKKWKRPKEIERSIGIDINRIDKADALLEAGATEVTLAVNGPGYDLSPVKEWISWRDSKRLNSNGSLHYNYWIINRIHSAC